MAYRFGTATDYVSLFDEIIDFLTTDSALASAGQTWTLLQEYGVSTHTLRAPGSGGESNIYMSLYRSTNPASPYFNIVLRGAVGYEAGQSAADQPFSSPRYHHLLCWDQPMPFWLFADGRHFKAFVKVGATYQNMFGGLILPNGTASEMPYPMYVAATVSSNISTTANHTASTYNYNSFWNPSRYGDFRASDNIWRPVSNYNGNSAETAGLSIWPWMGDNSEIGNFSSMRECFNSGGPGGGYPLWQAQLVATATEAGPNIHGYLPGVFWVPGFTQASENIVEIDGDDYVVFQAHRWSGRNDFCAIKVE